MTTVIAGAGVTGLELARLLGKDKPIVVSEEIGGMLSSFGTKGFTFDYGGHVYTREDKRVNELMAEAGAIQHERVAYYHDSPTNWVPYPVQDNADKLGVKVEHVPAIGPRNLEEWALGEFGPEFYTKFFRPFNQRVWTVDPVEMSHDWITNRVKRTFERSKDWGPNAMFQYAPSKDITTVMQRRALDAGAGFRNGRIIDVDLEKQEITYRAVSVRKRQTIKYDRLFWTLPITWFAPMVGVSSNQFISNSIQTVGVGLKAPLDMNHFNWMYGNISSPVHRVTWLSRYHPSLAPDGKDSLIFELPYRVSDIPPRRELSMGNIEIHAPYHYIKDLNGSEAYGIIKLAGFTEYIKYIDIEVAQLGVTKGYPVPTVNLRNVVSVVKQRLLKYQIKTVGRWGSWGYFNIDHCMNDAVVAVEGNEEDYLYSRHYYG
jgi:protoporphyrinogen oxidase